jgi:AraC-like DNA-binding protein
MPSAIARYREFEPCAALRFYIRAFFTFTMRPGDDPVVNDEGTRFAAREIVCRQGDSFWSALFADGHLSVVFCFGEGYRVDGLWNPGRHGPRGHVIGAMSEARTTSPGDSLVQVGAYLHAGTAKRFIGVPAGELTDRIVALEDLWGAESSKLEASLGEASGDRERIDRIESALLGRLAFSRERENGVDLHGLAAWAIHRQGRLTVACMANQAGVSRQYLARAFRENIGVPPKLYCRLARFQAALTYARRHMNVDSAASALEMGYADQSHMIAEFREFSGLTPGMFMRQRCFHPFIDRRVDTA